MQERLMWIGAILFVFGMTLAVSSYFNIYYWKQEVIGTLELPIAEKSTGDFLLSWRRMADMKKVEVHVYDFDWLSILNSTLNYS